MVAYNENLTNQVTIVTETKQNELINVFRLFIAFVVISIHVHADTPLANQYNSLLILFCVPYFFSTALTLLVKNLKKKTSPLVVLKKIWLRVGIPFITWSSIYLLLLFTKHTITGTGQPFTFYSVARIYLYGESTEHLYFLPELAVMQMIVIGIFMIDQTTRTKLGWFLLFSSALYIGWGSAFSYYGVTPLPTLIAYILCAFLIASNSLVSQYRKLYLFIGIILVTVTVMSSYFPSSVKLYDLPVGGIGLLLIALYANSFTIPTWMIVIASASYGIFLSHVLFLEAFEFIAEKIHLQLSYTLPVKLSVAFFIFSLSLLFTLLVRKVSLLRTTLLGEK